MTKKMLSVLIHLNSRAIIKNILQGKFRFFKFVFVIKYFYSLKKLISNLENKKLL